MTVQQPVPYGGVSRNWRGGEKAMKRLSIAILLALAAIGSVTGVHVAWAGSDDATGPNSIQAP